MRWSLAVLMAMGMFSSFSASPAPASPAGDAPFCIHGFIYGGGLGDCSFASFAQCQATASGQEASCLANPYYKANPETQPARGRVSRRRQ